MNTKTVCPPDCPGRYPGCGAHCKTFLEHRAEREQVYKKRAAQVQISAILDDGFRKTARK